MKRFLALITLLVIGSVTVFAQIRFSANADVYNEKNNQKVGTQYIAANIGSNGSGTMTLGSLTLKATITNSHRDNTYQMTAYSVTLYSQGGKTVDAVITKRDKGTCTVLVYYAYSAQRVPGVAEYTVPG